MFIITGFSYSVDSFLLCFVSGKWSSTVGYKDGRNGLTNHTSMVQCLRSTTPGNMLHLQILYSVNACVDIIYWNPPRRRFYDFYELSLSFFILRKIWMVTYPRLNSHRIQLYRRTSRYFVFKHKLRRTRGEEGVVEESRVIVGQSNEPLT